MPLYRINLLALDGGIRETTVIECNGDDQAIDLAGASGHPHAIDVWEHDRHVIRFPPWPPEGSLLG